MISAYWPLAGLRLRTGDLELRLPDAADLDALARLAERGVHDPALMPFMVPWTDAEPTARALATMQYHWSKWAAWQPDDWSHARTVPQAAAQQGGLGAAPDR